MAFSPAPIFILEPDGSKEEFRIEELKQRLYGCFLAVGRPDSAHLSADIALAVEVSLRDVARPERIFGRGEIDAAIVRFLENSGFPDVARRYAAGGSMSVITVSTGSRDVLETLLRRHIACSPERFERILDEVMAATKKLDIPEATPMFLLEMARHYERKIADTPLDISVFEPPQFNQSDWVPLLSPSGADLVENGILRVGGMNTIVPSIRFYFLIMDYAKWKNWQPPLTEMMVVPDLIQVGRVIEEVRQVIDRAFGAKESLPCTLAFPDMHSFLRDYFQVEWSGMNSIATELAGAIVPPLGDHLHEWSF